MLSLDDLSKIIKYWPEDGSFEWLVRRSRRYPAGNRFTPKGHVHGYAQIKIAGVCYLAHRLAWGLQTGDWPKETVDHINGDRADNRFINLREATRLEQTWNRRGWKNARVASKGVSICSTTKLFYATIQVRGTPVFLGRFNTVEEASAAYIGASRVLQKEFRYDA